MTRDYYKDNIVVSVLQLMMGPERAMFSLPRATLLYAYGRFTVDTTRCETRSASTTP